MKKIEILLIIFISVFVTYNCTKMINKNSSTIDYTTKGMLYNTYNKIEENKSTSVEKVEVIKEESKKQVEPKKETKEVKKETIVSPKKEEIKEEPKDNTSLETITGTMSGYGHDCYGCTSNRTASGYNIETATTYYDNTYGDVKILSADSKYPFGTIVKISNYNNLPSFYAIVLDRGGSIGLNKKINFDLLYPSNDEALGIRYNVKFDIIRMGY